MPLDLVTQARLQQQLAQITAQIASGVNRASYEGKSTEFRSLEELYKIRDDLMGQLGMTGGRVRRTVAAYSSGFYPGGGPY